MRDKQSNAFRPGVTFDHTLNLYVFDRKLRILLMDALERIEVAVKASLSNETSATMGPFWLADPANFDRGAHPRVIEDLDEVVKKGAENNQHTFLAHYYKTYSSPKYPPCWMLMEAMSFGAASRTFKCLRGEHQKPVATRFDLHQTTLGSWLHTLAFTRNVCAHHALVWRRTFPFMPIIPRNPVVLPPGHPDKLYIRCAMLRHLMNVIADGSQWPERLRALISERPQVPLSEMGFPDDWETIGFWGFS